MLIDAQDYSHVPSALMAWHQALRTIIGEQAGLYVDALLVSVPDCFPQLGKVGAFSLPQIYTFKGMCGKINHRLL